MKQLTVTRWLPWLLLAVCPPLLNHCGGAVEHATETGNPPVVEQQKLHVVLRDTGVEVVGDAGAVSPGASVRVTNRTSGASVEATARPDGSINLVVPGALQDEYDVTVSNGAGAQTVRVSTTTGDSSTTGSTGAAGGGSRNFNDCDALENALVERVRAGFARADQSCQSDSDCVDSPRELSCYHGCSDYVVSASGAAAAQATVEQDIASLCGELASCIRGQGNCGHSSSTKECYQGTCRLLDLDSLSCADLPREAAARVTDAINSASRTCSRDSDCALAQAELSCVASCGNLYHGVASSALEDLTHLIAQTDGLYCGLAESRGCPAPIQLPCEPMIQTPSARCNAGLCEVAYAPMP